MRTSKQSDKSASRCNITLQVAHRFLYSSEPIATFYLYNINRQFPVMDNNVFSVT